MTARTIEAYHVFKKTLSSLLVKFLKSAIPQMQIKMNLHYILLVCFHYYTLVFHKSIFTSFFTEIVPFCYAIFWSNCIGDKDFPCLLNDPVQWATEWFT